MSHSREKATNKIPTLTKNELPFGWKLTRHGKDFAVYNRLRATVSANKEGDRYWLDWGMKDGDVIGTSFVKDSKKLNQTIKSIMNKEFALARN